MAYDNTNQGAIWRNDERLTDKHPHLKGQANIDGVDYWVSAWKRDPDGNPKAPALKFSFQRKEQKAAPKQPETNTDPSDEIPF